MQTEIFRPAMPSPVFWTDGLDGQEDELDDVEHGQLEPATDDEAGEFFEPNKGDVALEKLDEEGLG